MDDINKMPDQTSEEKLEVIKYQKPNPNKKFWILLLITCLLIAAMFAWKEIAVSKAERDAEKIIEANSIISRNAVVAAHQKHLQLLAKPLVWSIRTEMLSGNMGQVHLYANELVKEKGFEQINIIDTNGVVISATDKKNEGKSFSSFGNASLLSGNTTNVETLPDSSFRMSSPIMGFNSRLGTIVIDYNPKS